MIVIVYIGTEMLEYNLLTSEDTDRLVFALLNKLWDVPREILIV